eukprot:767762-Pyramimonas_sp.AAC.1
MPAAQRVCLHSAALARRILKVKKWPRVPRPGRRPAWSSGCCRSRVGCSLLCSSRLKSLYNIGIVQIGR